MKKYSRVNAIIDLDAIVYNMNSMKNNVKDDTKMIGVIKADGYGHGAVQIAKVLSEKEYMWGFAVEACDSAITLRNNGITLPILNLGYSFEEYWEDMIENEVRMTLYSYETAKALAEVAKNMGKKAYIHIKIDTGMSRIGFLPGKEAVEEIVKIKAIPELELEAMYTHFAKADEIDKTATYKQLDSYLYMKEELAKAGVVFPIYHVANSAAIIDMPDLNMDLVRAGISLYGLYPSDEVKKEAVPIKPVMSVISHVTHVKWLDAGVAIGYGGTYVTDKKTLVATVPVGYGDGYPRSLSNKGSVLIHGKRAQLIGRVCMDQFMVDATDIDVAVGDEVVLFGKSEGAELTVDELSKLSGRFNYEFVCDLGKRIPRTFIRNGKIIDQVDYF